MRIIKANTLQAREDLLGMIGNIPTDTPIEAIKTWLTLNLGTDMFSVFMAIDGDDIVGFITGEAVMPHDPAVFIAFNYVKPGFDINKDLVEHIETWAKGLGIYKLLFYTKRSPKTFIKKYGFHLVQSVLAKELTNGCV